MQKAPLWDVWHSCFWWFEIILTVWFSDPFDKENIYSPLLLFKIVVTFSLWNFHNDILFIQFHCSEMSGPKVIRCCYFKVRVKKSTTTIVEEPRAQFVKCIGTSVRRSSRSAFGRSTGNDVSGHYKRHYFLFSFFFSSPSSTFLIEGVLGSKNLFSESWRERPKT